MKTKKSVIKFLSGVSAASILVCLFNSCCPIKQPYNNTVTLEQYIEASKKYEQEKLEETQELEQ